jgi:hypothetical protein
LFEFVEEEEENKRKAAEKCCVKEEQRPPTRDTCNERCDFQCGKLFTGRLLFDNRIEEYGERNNIVVSPLARLGVCSWCRWAGAGGWW